MLLGEKGMDCFNWKSNILLRSLIRLLLVYDKKIHTTLWMDIIGWSWFNFMYIFDEIVFQLIRYIYSIYLLVFIYNLLMPLAEFYKSLSLVISVYEPNEESNFQPC